MRQRLARACILSLLLGGCIASGAGAPVDDHGDGTVADMLPDRDVQIAQSPPQDMMPFAQQAPPGTAWVASCPAPSITNDPPIAKECMTLVETFDADSGERLFYADSREAGAYCNAWLPLGTHIEIRTQASAPGCQLGVWRSGFGYSEGMACACEGASDPICRFTVEQDSYCGAVFVKDAQ